MDEKTWKEVVSDAHTTPWWVHELLAETKRARESEAGLVSAAVAYLEAQGHSDSSEVARPLREAIAKARGE